MVEVRLEGSDRDFAFLLSPFILFGGHQWVLPVVALDQRRGMYVVC